MSLCTVSVSVVTESVLGLMSEGDVHLLVCTKESTVTWVTRPSRGPLSWIGSLSSVLAFHFSPFSVHLEAQLTLWSLGSLCRPSNVKLKKIETGIQEIPQQPDRDKDEVSGCRISLLLRQARVEQQSFILKEFSIPRPLCLRNYF